MVTVVPGQGGWFQSVFPLTASVFYMLNWFWKLIYEADSLGFLCLVFFLTFCFVLGYNQLTVFQVNSRGAQLYIEVTVLYQIYFLFKLHYNLSITFLKD